MNASTTPKVSLSVGAAGLQPLTCGKLIPPAGPEPDCAALDDETCDAVSLEEVCASETVPLEDESVDVEAPDGVSVAELDDRVFSPEDGDSLSGVALLSLEYEISDDEISPPQAHRKNETNPQKIFFFIAYKITLFCGNSSVFVWFYIRKMCVE